MPAIVAIIAKLLTLVDAAMENLVIAWVSDTACNTYAVQTAILPCGIDVANQIEGLIVSGVHLLNELMGALGVVRVA
jgi:hypothetical protein